MFIKGKKKKKAAAREDEKLRRQTCRRFVCPLYTKILAPNKL